MTKTFLKAKHWHLFLLTFGIPLILQIVLMIIILMSKDDISSVATMFFYFMIIFPLVMIINMGVMFGWYWSVVIGLKDKIPERVSLNYRRFKIFFFFPLIYIMLFIVFFALSFIGFGNTYQEINPIFSLLAFAIVIPLHLFAMFCMFYTLYFVSKSFKTVELQRKVKSSDYIGEFFLIWFFPIGIWFIQPKLNKMISQTNE